MTRPTRNPWLLLAAILLFAWFAEGDAAAQPYFHLVNKHSGRCLGVAGASTALGASVDQYNCDTGAGQYWSFVNLGTGAPAIRNLNSNLCVEIENASLQTGARLRQHTCDTGTNQQFSIAYFPATGKWFELIAQHSNKCLDGDPDGGDPQNGDSVVQSPCTGSLNREFWVLVP